MFTVGKLAELSGVTVKALHHYHRIGLVVPSGTSAAGYRLYSRRDLERLQQVLFYKELDFGLSEIKKAMSNEHPARDAPDAAATPAAASRTARASARHARVIPATYRRRV